MKKFIAFLLFFGSFGVAMAQTPADWYQRFRGLFVGPPVQIPRILFPNATRAINAVTSIITCATPDELAHCRAQGQQAEGEPDGSEGRTCGTSGNCHGVRPGHRNFGSNPCRPRSCSAADIRPSDAPTPPQVNITVTNVSCTKPNQTPNNQCEWYKTGMGGSPTDAERVELMRRYEICMREMMHIMQRPGKAVGSVSVSISGGSEGPYSANTTVEGALFSPYQSASAEVVVKNKKGVSVMIIPITLYCPVLRPSFDCGRINVADMSKEEASRVCVGQSDGLCRLEAAYGPSGSGQDGYYCVSR